jgi:hypothetical protein
MIGYIEPKDKCSDSVISQEQFSGRYELIRYIYLASAFEALIIDKFSIFNSDGGPFRDEAMGHGSRWNQKFDAGNCGNTKAW